MISWPGYSSYAAINAFHKAIPYRATPAEANLYVGSWSCGIENLFSCYTNFTKTSYRLQRCSWSKIVNELECASKYISQQIGKGVCLNYSLEDAELLKLKIKSIFHQFDAIKIIHYQEDSWSFKIAENAPKSISQLFGLQTRDELKAKSDATKNLVRKCYYEFRYLANCRDLIRAIDSVLNKEPILRYEFSSFRNHFNSLNNLSNDYGFRLAIPTFFFEEFFNKLDRIHQDLELLNTLDSHDTIDNLNQIADELLFCDLKRVTHPSAIEDVNSLPIFIKGYRIRKLKKALTDLWNTPGKDFNLKAHEEEGIDEKTGRPIKIHYINKAEFRRLFPYFDNLLSCSRDILTDSKVPNEEAAASLEANDREEWINVNLTEISDDLLGISDDMQKMLAFKIKIKSVVRILLTTRPENVIDELGKVTSSSEELKKVLNYIGFDQESSSLLVEAAQWMELDESLPPAPLSCWDYTWKKIDGLTKPLMTFLYTQTYFDYDRFENYVNNLFALDQPSS